MCLPFCTRLNPNLLKQLRERKSEEFQKRTHFGEILHIKKKIQANLCSSKKAVGWAFFSWISEICVSYNQWSVVRTYGLCPLHPPGPQTTFHLQKSFSQRISLHPRHEKMQKQRKTLEGDQIVIVQSLSKVKDLQLLLRGYR